MWTVIEPVVRALTVAESFRPGPHPLNVQDFADRYRTLQEWINDHAEAEGLEPVPADWVLSPRQFRRTLSRELAWRPGGVIAGKVHLKHISVATTEGYAGQRGESSKSFLAEIEAERRRVNEDATQAVVAAIQGGAPVAGLGAKALTTAVAQLDDNPSMQGAQVRDRDDAIATLIRTRAETLHITPLCYCWFTNPELARCLRGTVDKSKPLVGSCVQGKCPNATIHPEHAVAWVSGLDELRKTLADRRVPRGERARLTAKADEMQAVVDTIVGGE